MSGSNSLVGKVRFGLVFCSDRMAERAFDEGLGNLKRIAESA